MTARRPSSSRSSGRGDEEGAARDLSALGRVTDAVRERFGDAAVSYGRDLRFSGRTSDTAPMNKSDF